MNNQFSQSIMIRLIELVQDRARTDLSFDKIDWTDPLVTSVILDISIVFAIRVHLGSIAERILGSCHCDIHVVLSTLPDKFLG